MVLGKMVSIRMKEIMEQKHMTPVDFIRTESEINEKNKHLITSSRFYEIYNGKNENPKLDFIQSFCDIAGIEAVDFFRVKNQSSNNAYSDEEVEIIRLKRSLSRNSEKALLKYVRYLAQEDSDKE